MTSCFFAKESASVDKIDVYEAVQHFVVKQLEDDATGHGLDHIKRVVALAQHLASFETTAVVNMTRVELGAWLHETFDSKLVRDVDERERQLRALLNAHHMPESEQVALLTLIKTVSYQRTLSHPSVLEDSIEAKIVRDADFLDALGAIGIARTFYYGGAKGDQIYHPDVLPREVLTADNYRLSNTVVNHFYEKLFLLPDLMSTTQGKKIAHERVAVMKEFLNSFYKEWHFALEDK